MPSKIRGGTADKHLADMHIPRVSALAKPGGGLGLKTNLIAWWELDEASGNRADSHTNGLTLTDSNTVTSNPGVGGVGTAAQFTRTNNESLLNGFAALDISNNQDISLVAWVYLDSQDRMGLVANGTTSDVLRFQTYGLFYNDPAAGYGGTGNRFMFNLANSAGTAASQVFANTFGDVATSTWYMIAATFNASTDQMKISVNAGAQDTTSGVTSTGPDREMFAIGRPGHTNGNYTNGRIAKVGFWKDRVLTVEEITALYNSGAGRTYAEL